MNVLRWEKSMLVRITVFETPDFTSTNLEKLIFENYNSE